MLDVSSSFTFSVVRQLIESQPANVARLIYQCINTLQHAYTSSRSISETTGKPQGIREQDCKPTINSIRILTRIMSVIIELPPDHPLHKYCTGQPLQQQQQTHEQPEQQPHAHQQQSHAEEHNQPSNVNAQPAPINNTVVAAVVSESSSPVPDFSLCGTFPDSLCVGGRVSMCVAIVRCLLSCLFLEGFTIPIETVKSTIELDEHKVVDGVDIQKLWEFSVGPVGIQLDNYKHVNKDVYNATFDNHRTELLQCLLVCFSSPMFAPAATDSTSVSPFLVSFCSESVDMAPTLLWSLVNVVTAYDTSSLLPYTHTLRSDHREPLVDAALQVLLCIIDYRTAQHEQQQPAQHQHMQQIGNATAHRKVSMN